MSILGCVVIMSLGGAGIVVGGYEEHSTPLRGPDYQAVPFSKVELNSIDLDRRL